jgi:hypothetical protein
VSIATLSQDERDLAKIVFVVRQLAERINGPLNTAVAFADRPASPSEGMLFGFTDSSNNAWGATIAGGGANHVLGYYNGTSWTVAAK